MGAKHGKYAPECRLQHAWYTRGPLGHDTLHPPPAPSEGTSAVVAPNTVSVFVAYDPDTFGNGVVLSCDLLGIEVRNPRYGGDHAVEVGAGLKRLHRRGPTVFVGEIEVPHGVLPPVVRPGDYRPAGGVILAFDVVIETEETKHGRFGLGKEKHQRETNKLPVRVRVDGAQASRVVFIPDIEGAWHTSGGFDCAAAYEAFVPGVLSTAVGLCGGGHDPRRNVTAAAELAWLHSLLQNYLDGEAEVFAEWLRRSRELDGGGLLLAPTPVPRKPLTPSQVVRGLGGGFAASPPCLAVARVLAEAHALAEAGHLGVGWDATREVLLEQVGGPDHAMLEACRPDVQRMAAARPPQDPKPPTVDARATLAQQWPMLEAVAVWACVGLALRRGLARDDHEARHKIIAQFEATMSFVDLRNASVDNTLLAVWRDVLNDAIREGCTAVTELYAQPGAKSFSWLQVTPALCALDVTPQRADAEAQRRGAAADMARAGKYARAVAKIDLVQSGAMDQLSLVLSQAPTLESAADLLTPFRSGSISGEPAAAAGALREAIELYLTDYTWPKNSREKDIATALSVLSTPVAAGGLIVTMGRNAAVLGHALQTLTAVGHPLPEVIALAGTLCQFVAIHCTEAECGAAVTELVTWGDQVHAGLAHAPDRLRLFSAVLRHAFAATDGFAPADPRSESHAQQHTMYRAVVGGWRQSAEHLLAPLSSQEALLSVPLRWRAEMVGCDPHDWVCVAELGLALADKTVGTDPLTAFDWLVKALDPAQSGQDHKAPLAGIGRALQRLSAGHVSDRRKREAMAALVYLAIASAIDAAVRRTLAGGPPERQLEFEACLRSRHFGFFLEAVGFVAAEREVARRNLEKALDSEASARGSPLVQLAKAVPERNLWQRVENAVFPVMAAFALAAKEVVDGTMRVRQLVGLRDANLRDLFCEVMASHGGAGGAASGKGGKGGGRLTTTVGRWLQADREARVLLRQMIDSTAEVAPNAPELAVLGRLEAEWPELPLLAIDLVLAGDGLHPPTSQLGRAELLGRSDFHPSAGSDAARPGDPASVFGAVPALHAFVKGTALEVLAVEFNGAKTIRMLTWLAAVRGSPLFKELRRSPPPKPPAAAAGTRGRDSDAVCRIATGGAPLVLAPADVGTLTLHRGRNPLGLTLAGPRDASDSRTGVYVADVAAGTSAAAHRSLVPGLRVTHIDGRDVSGLTQPECTELLEAVPVGETVDLTLSRHCAPDGVAEGGDGVSELERTLTELFELWHDLYMKFCTESITFRELSIYGELLSATELQCLAETASIGGGWSDWRRNRSTSSWATTRMASVQQFLELNQRRDALATAIAVVSELGQYIENGRAIHGGLHALQRGLQSSWTDNSLASMSGLMTHTAEVDTRLLGIDRGLIEALRAHPELIQWMREALESDFQQAVEIVSGLGEAQCPDDLWEERDKKLGSLSEVRQQLQAFIFRPTDKFGSLPELTDTLIGVSATVVEHLHACAELLVPFSLAFSSDPDSVAPRRLAMFRDPERRAAWKVGWSDARSAPTVSVEYKVRRRRQGDGGREVLEYAHTKALDLHELEDFQSSLVLVQSVGTAEEQAMIEDFFRQYHLALRILEIMVQLRDAGHFDYQSLACQFRYALKGGTADLQEDVATREAELATWEADLDQARRRYFALNNVTLRQLWAMVRVLAGHVDSDLGRHAAEAGFKANFELIVPGHDLALDAVLQIGPPWTPAEAQDLTSSERLDRCGKWLDDLVAAVPLRRRALSAPADPPQGSGSLRPGVNLAVCGANESPFTLALSLFAVAGWLPEREELLFCTDETTWELIRNFLYRWELSGAHSRGDRLFVICGLDRMPFAVQNRAAKIIRQAIRQIDPEQSAPLVVVVRSEVGHVVGELSPYRVAILSLPQAELSTALAEVSTAGSGGMVVVTSLYAGTGKTFWIRSEATRRKHQLIKVPVHSEIPTAELIQRLRRGFADVESDEVLRTESGKASSRAFGLLDAPLPSGGGGISPEHTEPPPPYAEWAESVLLQASNPETLGSPEVPVAPADVVDDEDAELARAIALSAADANAAAGEGDTDDDDDDGLAQALAMSLMDTGIEDDDPDLAAAIAASLAHQGGAPAHIDISDSHSTADPTAFAGWKQFSWYGRPLFVNSSEQKTQWSDPAHRTPFGGGLELPDEGQGHQGVTCHVTISRRVGPVVEAALFEVLAFGSLIDAQTGEFFLWDGGSTGWAVEVACDVSLRELPFLAALPQQRMRVHPGGFSVDETELYLGMGANFVSSRFDGSTPMSSGSCNSNAAFRVQKVARRLKALAAVDLNAGGVVVDPPEDSLEIRREEAFDLIARASGQNEASASLTAMWAFINVMFWQLWDLEQGECVARSVMCVLDVDNPGRGRWFQLKLSDLIVKTARDFAPRCPVLPADGADVDPHQRGLAQVDGLVKWKDSNHQCILFQSTDAFAGGGQAGGGVSFLAVDYAQLTQSVGRHLKDIFEQQQFQLQPSEEEIVQLAPSIFSTISGIMRSADETAGLLHGGYVMTNDNLLKMVAIFVRVRCGVPVVLMGECGCGKSLLMKFVCAFLNVRLLTLDVHGGTTQDDILNVFAEAETLCIHERGNVWVFLDEVNTSSEIGLLTEAIVHRSVNGRSLNKAIQVVGAVNPYRRKPQREGPNVGLRLNQHAGGGGGGAAAEAGPGTDVLDDLVYRVHPLPASLLATVFDFGHLEDEIEAMYIRVMVDRQFPRFSRASSALLAALVHRSQTFVRDWEQESSAVSLRDVQRSLSLISWFAGPGSPSNHGGRPVVQPIAKRVLNHTQFAADNKLEWPCPEPYSEYVAERIASGARVILLEARPEYSLPAGETGVVRSLDDMRHPPSASASVIFPLGGGGLEAHLPLHVLQVVSEDEVTTDGPSTMSKLEHRAAALALAHVYFYRLNDQGARTRYFQTLAEAARAAGDAQGIAQGAGDAEGPEHPDKHLFLLCSDPGLYGRVIAAEQDLYCENMVIEDGIARNQALQENIFVVIVSMCNRIPVFIVGRPGTSKSLSLRLIASNLRGEHSPTAFFKRFPAVHVVPYQCSPHSTSDSITFQFRKAVEYASSRGQDSLTVLLLDEVGLAELSPDLPLKVLHEMLVNPPIAIVGISNWVLDPAKMNRACILQRPDPGEDELSRTARAIAGSLEDDSWVVSLSTAFHEIYTHQDGRPWIGMRDFYSLIKAIRRAPREKGSLRVEWPVFFAALCRNFGGKPIVLQRVLRTFRQQLQIKGGGAATLPSPLSLIRNNLADPEARHLMVLTVHGAAMALLFQCKVIELGESTKVLIGSSFSSDASEYHLISQINSIKRAMQVGQRVVLLNCDALYEALYDVLNQAFVTRVVSGKEQKFLRLAVGKRSQLCPVHDNFRLIAVTERDHAYNDLDLPLLNRLEKQLLLHSDVCEEQKLTGALRNVTEFMESVLGECGTSNDAANVGHFFPGYHESTIASLVLAADEEETKEAEREFDGRRFQEELRESAREDAGAAFTAAIKSSDTVLQLSLIANMIKSKEFKMTEQTTESLRRVYHARKSALRQGALSTTCREVLARCATPLAILKSRTLRSSCGDLFEDLATGEVTRAQTHDSLVSYLKAHIASTSTSDTIEEKARVGGHLCTFALVMTRSPSAHLEVSLSTVSKDSELSKINITRLQLADFESERSFQTQIQNYFETETTDETLLIVQCDPFLTPSVLIDHARYICRNEGERSRRRELLSCTSEFQKVLASDAVMSKAEYVGHVQAGFVPLFPRHVVFVLHVPLGIAKRARVFPLTFEKGWDRLFIDDLLVENEDVSTVKLLRRSVLEIAESSAEFEIKGFVTQKFMGALAMVIHPQQPTSSELYHECLFPQRIATFRKLLESTEFVQLLTVDIRVVLRDYCEQHYNDGLHAHVQMAMLEAGRLGTLRQSLVSAIQTILHAAIATVIARFDRNYNLRVLETEKVPPELWYAMSALRHQGRNAMAKIEDNTYSVVVKNDGQHGAHCCRFPFSYALIHQLEEKRKGITEMGHHDVRVQLDGLLPHAIGEAAQQVTTFFASDPVAAFDAFIHDFIEQVAPAFPSLSTANQRTVYIAVLTEQNATTSPGAIHAIVGSQETRLFVLCTILDTLSSMKKSLLEDVMKRLEGILTNLDALQLRSKDRLPAIEETVIGFVIKQLTYEASHGTYGVEERRAAVRGDLELWCQLVGQLRPHFGTFWTQLVAASSGGEAIVAQELLTDWIRVETYKTLLFLTLRKLMDLVHFRYCLIASEVMVPTLRILEQDELDRVSREREGNINSLRRKIDDLRRDWQYERQRGRRGWFGYATTWSNYDPTEEIERLERKISDLRALPPVNTPIRPVVQQLARVLQNVAQEEPFEADTIFLHISQISDALRNLLNLQASRKETRHRLLQRFVHRFFVELVCRQPQDTWPPSLVAALVNLALGTKQRVDREILTPSLQKALLHRVFENETEQRFIEAIFETIAGTTLDTRQMLVQYFEVRYEWLQYRIRTTECDVCCELRTGAEMCSSVCGHTVCGECLDGDVTGALSACHQCRNPEPFWLGPGFLKNVGRLLASQQDVQDTPEDRLLLSKLSAIGLARFAVRALAMQLMEQYDSEGGGVGPTPSALAVTQFLQTSGHEDSRNWCLSVIRRHGGSTYLDGLLRNAAELIPWFEPQCEIETVETVHLPFDPFSDKRDRHAFQVYVHAVGELTPGVLTGQYNMDALSALKQGVGSRTLLGILFTAVYCSVVQVPTVIIPEKVSRIFRSFDMPGCSRFARGLTDNFTELPPSLPTARSLLVVNAEGGEAKLISSLVRIQVLVHVARLGLSLPRSWYGALLTGDLGEQRKSYIPSMPEDEISMIIRATRRGEEACVHFVRSSPEGSCADIWFCRYARLNEANGGINGSVWYMCANGHPYSVGHCGQNTMTAKCPCGAPIGGRDHHTREDNTQLTQDALADRLAAGVGRGYMQSGVVDKGGDSVQREVSPLAVRVLRLILHGTLLIRGLETMDAVDVRIHNDFADFVSENSTSVSAAVEFLSAQFLRDWDALRSHLELAEENVALFLHLVLGQTWETGTRERQAIPARCDSPERRANVEREWERKCVKPFTTGLGGHLDEARERFQPESGGGADWHLQRLLGEGAYRVVSGHPGPDSFWGYNESLTMDGFRRAVANAESDAPGVATLRKFLEVEEELPNIKHLPSVLTWHRVIFEALEGGVTRAQARDMTNGDLIALLPGAVRWRAREAFENFKQAWDTIMPRIDILFECQENPYRDPANAPIRNGGVLVGHVPMSDDQQLMFSLPNVAKGEEGLECTCTIAMLDQLQRLHNSMLLAFRKSQPGGQASAPDGEATASPIVNYLTSPRVVGQKLLVYDRMTNLFPVLLAHSHDTGQGREYNLELIAEAVELLFEGKDTIMVHCRHVVFNGELQKVGLLAKLGLAVRQADLQPDVKARIADELDTQERCTAAMVFLERCIRFVASLGSGAGGAGIDGGMTLEQFVTAVLHVDPAEWALIRTPTLADGIKLETLGSGYSFLEECLSDGNPLDAVLGIYKVPLSGETLAETQRATGVLDLPVLLPVFRHFLNRLRDGFSADPQHPLKVWLANEPVNESTVLDDLPWFADHFPEQALMSHAVATFRTLSGDV